MSGSDAHYLRGRYRRLQQIAEEVNQAEVPVDRMADLFAEGKGLDRALSDHLAEQKAHIERIERGEEIQASSIVPPTDDGDRAAAPPKGGFEAASVPTGDDDIPF